MQHKKIYFGHIDNLTCRRDVIMQMHSRFKCTSLRKKCKGESGKCEDDTVDLVKAVKDA